MKLFFSNLILVVSLSLISCDGNGGQGKTTDTDSSAFGSLAEKQAFLERYVEFRQSYEVLQFHINFIDGGDGGVPAPSEWDVRIFAMVPADEIDNWTAGMTKVESVDTSWVSAVPNTPTRFRNFEWYQTGNKVVGVSRADRGVLYRNFAN